MSTKDQETDVKDAFQNIRTRIARVDKKLLTIDKNLTEFKLQQRIIVETSRKTANSTMVIIRHFAKQLNWTDEELSNILINADAHQHTLTSTDGINLDGVRINWNDYPIDKLKSMLVRLVKQIDLCEQRLNSGHNNFPYVNSPTVNVNVDSSKEFDLVEIGEGKFKIVNPN